MNLRTISALIAKDFSLFFRNRFIAVITVLGIVAYLAIYFAMPSSVNESLEIALEQAMDVIPGLPGIWDEPFSDFSQIPTYLVSQLARRHVTVSLSGDGGDELFCGYNRHIVGPGIWDKVSCLPDGPKRLLGSGLGFLAGNNLDFFALHFASKSRSTQYF